MWRYNRRSFSVFLTRVLRFSSYSLRSCFGFSRYSTLFFSVTHLPFFLAIGMRRYDRRSFTFFVGTVSCAFLVILCGCALEFHVTVDPILFSVTPLPFFLAVEMRRYNKRSFLVFFALVLRLSSYSLRSCFGIFRCSRFFFSLLLFLFHSSSLLECGVTTGDHSVSSLLLSCVSLIIFWGHVLDF